MALVYPNSYAVGMSSLGFQLVYGLLGRMDGLVCERFFLDDPSQPLRSLESGHLLSDFPLIFCSISFEHDYLNLVRLLRLGGIQPLAEDRDEQVRAGQPLVICGGVVTFMNPEPLAPFVDLFLVGEAEPVLDDFMNCLLEGFPGTGREELLAQLAREVRGCYAPRFYKPQYGAGETGAFQGFNVTREGLPKRIAVNRVSECQTAAHSQVLTPEAEFSDLYLTELGRGCSRGCRFCAAGFIYRPPRLWDAQAVRAGVEQRFTGVNRVGLLGMEMAPQENLAELADYLRADGCSLSFSSLRADRISGPLLELLAASDIKSVAIAPDGASERLRRVINKGLDRDDLLDAAERLVGAGLNRLKLYVMIGLPTETEDDLAEFVELIRAIKKRILPLGRSRGHLTEINLSLNSFVPKPWTPFQFHAFGVSEQLAPGEIRPMKQALGLLKGRIKWLQKELRHEANVRMNHDKPEQVLFQAVLSRADRRMGPVLLDMADSGRPWKQAMKRQGLTPEQFAVCGHGREAVFPWSLVGQEIEQDYLWHEYMKGLAEKTTVPCDTALCKRCGVCNAE